VETNKIFLGPTIYCSIGSDTKDRGVGSNAVRIIETVQQTRLINITDKIVVVEPATDRDV
jgi:hypothetical protein